MFDFVNRRRHSSGRGYGSAGFSLIETLVALLVFSVMVMGLVPVFITSLRGSAISRSFTVGKNIGLQAMEQARGLPYHVSYLAQNKKVDVLDFYFPNYVASGIFTTTCIQGSSNLACPKNLSPGVSVTYTATFVRPNTGTNPETYTPITPAVGYRWDSTTGADAPPASLLSLRVTTQWTEVGRERNLDLTTIIGNKRFELAAPAPAPSPSGASSAPPAVIPENIKVRASANQEYTIQVVTGYRDSTGKKTELIATAGASDSFIEVSTAAVARQATRSGQARLVQLPATDTEFATDISTIETAQYVRQAPPSANPWVTSAIGKKTMRHPVLNSDIAFFGDTYTEGYTLTPSSGLPNTYAIFESDIGDKSAVEFWVDNQAISTAPLRLTTTKPMVQALERDAKSAGADDMWGGSQANTTSLTASNRRAEAVARAEIWDLNILPTSFASTGVVWIQNLLARTQCTSTANRATAVGSTSFSATLRYWRDTTNDGVLNGSYATVTLSGTGGTDPLAPIKASNPLVYDGTTASGDVYLFDDPAAGKQGYLLGWTSLSSFPTSTDGSGRVTTADIDTALRVDTVATDPTKPESNLSISVANLTCKAEDYR